MIDISGVLESKSELFHVLVCFQGARQLALEVYHRAHQHLPATGWRCLSGEEAGLDSSWTGGEILEKALCP